MRKPARWAWNRGLLAPEWRSIAVGLEFLVPFWDAASGEVPDPASTPSEGWLRDVVNGYRYVERAAWGQFFSIGERGLQVQTGSGPTAGEGKLIWEYDGMWPLATADQSGPMSLVLLVNLNSDGADCGLLNGNSTANNLIWLDAPARLGVRFGSQSYVSADNSFPTDSLWHVIGVSFEYGGRNNVSAWLDGKRIINTTPSAAMSGGESPSGIPTVLGADGSTRSHTNTYGMFAMWRGRYLTDTDHKRLAADPFGLMRPLYIAGSLPTSAGVSSTTLAGSLFTSTATWHSGHTAAARFTVSVSQLGDGAEIGYGATPEGSTTLVGSLFTSTATFYAGTVDSDNYLTGVLFTSTATFYAGTAALEETLVGSLFTSTATFHTGTAALEDTLEGALFTSTATFYAGTFDSDNYLAGSLFTSTATWGTGNVSVQGGQTTLVGTPFTSTATFYTGTFDSDNYLTGSLFTSTATFHAGTTALQETLVGSLFTSTATFHAGTVADGGITFVGSLFTSTATFYVGNVQGSVTAIATEFQFLWSVEGATLPDHPDFDTLEPPAVQGPTYVPAAKKR